MPKRKIAKDYYAIAQKRNFKWLGPTVLNVYAKTGWECDNGHQWATCYNKLQRGSGCPVCAIKKRADSHRKKPKDYHVLANEYGFRWLGPKVLGTHINTNWECGRGHQWGACYSNIKQGYGCPHCAGNVQKAPEDYHALAKEWGFKWLGPTVFNANTKTTWECHLGHQWESIYNSISHGYGCPYCANNIRKKPKDYHAMAKKRGFKWLGSEVTNVDTKTIWECDKGHKWETTYQNIQRKHGCLICANQIPKKPTDYYALAKKKNFQWLGPEVPNIHTKTGWECDNGHCWEARYADIEHKGSGCPICKKIAFGKRSKEMWKLGRFDGVFKSPTSIEIEIATVLDTLGIKHVSQFRPSNYSRPFDEFIPPKLFIEIQGDYWHGNPLFYKANELGKKQRKNRQRDAEKAVWAKENGYCLVTIWEHEIKTWGARALIEEHVLPLSVLGGNHEMSA